MFQEKIHDFIVIGAGPIGIESAVMIKHHKMDVILFEQGSTVGYNQLRHSHNSMFSPWFYNYSPLGISILKKFDIFKMPQKKFLTPKEYVESYLHPLSSCTNLHIEFKTEVLKIAKQGINKTDLIGENRKKFPFKVLVKTANKEEFYYAWNIIDASGVYDNPLPLGIGRVDAIQESQLKDKIYYHAIDTLNKDIFLGKTSLVLGKTCCSAKSIETLIRYKEQNEKTKIIYVDETGLRPYITQLKNDIFEKRVNLIEKANSFLTSSDKSITVKQKCGVLKIQEKENRFIVTVVYFNNNQKETFEVDNIVSNFGFSPQRSLYNELEVHECYGSFAPMNLAEAMLEDTLDFRFTHTSLGADTLKNPEPNFYILGSKSYGRNQGFSIYIGIAQVAELFAQIFNKDIAELLHSPISEHSAIQYTNEKPVEEFSTNQTSAPSKVVASLENKYKTITENLQEIIFQTDLKQKITYLSPSWERVTGFSVDEYIGLDWQELLYGSSKEQGVCQCNAFMSKEVQNYHEEFQVQCKDGKLKWMEVKASILTDENNVAFGTIGSMVDITKRVLLLREIEEKNKLLDALAITDGLTGIYNRRYFDEMLLQEFSRTQRDGQNIALVMCDIDYFKQYNDTYGHQQGDSVIQKVAEVLKTVFSRNIDIVARYGGEEFVAIVTNIQEDTLNTLLNEIQERVKSLDIKHSKSAVSDLITLSLGVCYGTVNNIQDSSELLKIADKQLYKSKHNGRNSISISRL